MHAIHFIANLLILIYICKTYYIQFYITIYIGFYLHKNISSSYFQKMVLKAVPNLQLSELPEIEGNSIKTYVICFFVFYFIHLVRAYLSKKDKRF